MSINKLFGVWRFPIAWIWLLADAQQKQLEHILYPIAAPQALAKFNIHFHFSFSVNPVGRSDFDQFTGLQTSLVLLRLKLRVVLTPPRRSLIESLTEGCYICLKFIYFPCLAQIVGGALDDELINLFIAGILTAGIMLATRCLSASQVKPP